MLQIKEKSEKPSPTISETEIDMQKIQMKILTLEKNLQKFSSRRLVSIAPVELDTTPVSKESQDSSYLNFEEKEKLEKADSIRMQEEDLEENFNEETVRTLTF